MSSEFDKIVEEFFRTYQDRGMKKWAGFYLSDHTAKINRDKKRRETQSSTANTSGIVTMLSTLEMSAMLAPGEVSSP